MGRQPTTRLQVSGFRFLMRRMEHALVRGDVGMGNDPLRAQALSLTVGCILAAVALAGCALLAFLRPQAALGNAPIVMAHDSGALYVRIGDTMHPVLNLASARLIAGAAADPARVGGTAIATAKRGPLVGIPGAPSAIGVPLTPDESAWTVCDAPTGTTVIAGYHPQDGADRLDGQHAVLVMPKGGSSATTYLVYDGRRAQVDLRNAAVVRALHLDGVAPRRVSPALLESIPEAPGIAAPTVAGAGGSGAITGLAVGTVVRISRADSAEYYVILADGTQRIGEVTADLIRFTVAQPDREVPTVAADAIAAAPPVHTLPVATFPERVRPIDGPVLCGRWRPDGSGRRIDSSVWVAGSVPLPDESPSVPLAQADGDGPGVDAFHMPIGRSAYIRSTGILGEGGSGGSRYLIDDLGVVYGLHDETAANHLGLSVAAVPAPWPVLALLPRGPELSRERASIVRDTVVAHP